jgi:hypothetical protein
MDRAAPRLNRHSVELQEGTPMYRPAVKSGCSNGSNRKSGRLTSGKLRYVPTWEQTADTWLQTIALWDHQERAAAGK